MRLAAFVERRLYMRRAHFIQFWIRSFGLDFAVEYALRRGWVRRDLWENERRIQLVRVGWFR